MAIVVTALASLATSTGADNYDIGTAGVTAYTAGLGYVLFCTNTKATAADAVSGVTNSQVTFGTALGTREYSTSSTKLKRITAFYGECGSTGTSVTNVAFGGAAQTGFNGVVLAVAGHNATNAVVSGSFSGNVADTHTLNTTFTVTTPAVANVLNAIVAAFGQDTNGVMSPQNSFLELFDDGHGTPANRLAACWLINGDDPGYQRAATADWAGVAFEINEASVGGAVTHAHSKLAGISKLHGLVN